MKKTFLTLTLLCLSLPVCAGDFFGDLFNPDTEKHVTRIGDEQVLYATDKNGNRYVYSIGNKRILYATDKNGKKYVYSIGNKRIIYY